MTVILTSRTAISELDDDDDWPTIFRKMATSNEVSDSILDDDDVQTSSNIYDNDDDDH